MKKGDSRLKLAREPAVFHVRVGIIGATINLYTAGNYKHYLPVNGNLYLRNGLDFPGQSVHDDFEVWDG